MRNVKGFSLIELLIALAIVGILASIATVGYGSYIVKARRNAVEQTLVKATNILENCYSLNHSYEGCLDLNSLLAADDLDNYYADAGKKGGSKLEKGDFVLSVNVIGSQLRDEANCHVLLIDRQGRKMSASSGIPSSDVGNCWK